MPGHWKEEGKRRAPPHHALDELAAVACGHLHGLSHEGSVHAEDSEPVGC